MIWGDGPSRNSLLKISLTLWPSVVVPVGLPEVSRILSTWTVLPMNMSLSPPLCTDSPPSSRSCRAPVTPPERILFLEQCQRSEPKRQSEERESGEVFLVGKILDQKIAQRNRCKRDLVCAVIDQTRRATVVRVIIWAEGRVLDRRRR